MMRQSLLSNSYLFATVAFVVQLFSASAKATEVPNWQEDLQDDGVKPKLASNSVDVQSPPQAVNWRERLRRRSWEKLNPSPNLSPARREALNDPSPTSPLKGERLYRNTIDIHSKSNNHLPLSASERGWGEVSLDPSPIFPLQGERLHQNTIDIHSKSNNHLPLSASERGWGEVSSYLDPSPIFPLQGERLHQNTIDIHSKSNNHLPLFASEGWGEVLCQHDQQTESCHSVALASPKIAGRIPDLQRSLIVTNGRDLSKIGLQHGYGDASLRQHDMESKIGLQHGYGDASLRQHDMESKIGLQHGYGDASLPQHDRKRKTDASFGQHDSSDAGIIWGLQLAENPPNPNPNTPIITSSVDTNDFSIFPVGVNIGRRNVLKSILVRGREDGEKAIAFDGWLVPFDAVVEALRLDVKTLDDGQLEVRSPGLVTRINPQELQSDPELGLVFSVADIRRIFGVGVEFDLFEYAIAFDVPWLGRRGGRFAQDDLPVVLDGLPQFQPGGFSLAGVEQRLNAAGTGNRDTRYRGEFQAVGSVLGGSWFVRTDQPSFDDSNSWRIAEAQYLQQNNQRDLYIGSHPTFWQRQGRSGYFGFTYINRQGFRPPQRFTSGFSDPRQRLQAAQVGRTITGLAEPGSLVRLVEGFGDVAIAEVFVDSSGVYRFENITTKDDRFETNYRVFVYPEGRLTATPEIRNAEVSTVPGQLPVGASAWMASGGYRRRLDRDSGLLGSLTEFSGGFAGRWGVAEALTLGVGSIYDEGVRGIAEMFYRPRNFPLEMAVSAVSGNEWDIVSRIRFEPSRRFSVNFNSDRISQRLNVNWNLFRGLSVFADTDSRNPARAGFQFNFSRGGYSSFGRVSLNTENQLRWNWLQRLGKAELRQNGNEIGSLSEFTYNFARTSTRGNALLLTYETRNQNQNTNLLTVGWRYRSPIRTNDGYYRWEGQLGYGIGSRGNGIIASVGTTILPGILLRGRYQGVSLTSDESSFSIDLVSSLNLQAGFSPGDRRTDNLRTQGGLMLRPFFDRNNNGKRDRNEEFYTENGESLALINNKPLKRVRSEIKSDRINVRLFPGTYRVDLDPAGYPIDWQANEDAIAAKVIAGSYTPVMIPLIRAYSRTGVITDASGEPIAGARVEAVSSQGKRRFSVTNSAGVYYLERLQEGEYQILVNGESVNNLKLDAKSTPYQELNLKVSANRPNNQPNDQRSINPNPENNLYQVRLEQLLKRLSKNSAQI